MLGIYPEGTRSPDGRLYRGRTGVARLALESRAPVVPCAMIGTFEFLPRETFRPQMRIRPGVIFGKPLEFSQYYGRETDREALRAVTDEIMRAIHELSGQEYVVEYAKKSRYEETIAALACLCAVPIEVVDRLMGGERPDPILILCKSAGWGWPTAKAIIMARTGGKGTSSQGLDAAFANFERLSRTTAQRVMRFWQAHTTESGRGTSHDGRRTG